MAISYKNDDGTWSTLNVPITVKGGGEPADLSNYYTKDETYSKQEVDNAIDAIEIPESPDLSDYAKKSEIPDVSKFITEVPSEYITETELSAKGYLTEATYYYRENLMVDHVADKVATKADKEHEHEQYLTELPEHTHDEYLTELPEHTHDQYLTELPEHTHDEYLTELPEHTHDQYLTEHQSLAEYAKKSEIPDISTKADKEHTHSQYLTEHQSLAGYATEKYVDDAIAGIEIPEGGGSTDLTNYYTKDETYSKTEVDDLIADIDVSGGGGSSESGAKIIVLKDLKSQFTQAEVAELYAFYQQYYTNKKMPDGYAFYYKSSDTQHFLVTDIRVSLNKLSFYYVDPRYTTQYYYFYLTFSSDGSSISKASKAYESLSSGSDESWHYSGSPEDSSLYSARELSIWFHSTYGNDYIAHFATDGQLGNHTWICFELPHADNPGYWYYDGYSIGVSDSSNWTFTCAYYKQ